MISSAPFCKKRVRSQNARMRFVGYTARSPHYSMSLTHGSLKPGFHIVISDGDVSQSVDRRCCWDAYDDMGTFFW